MPELPEVETIRRGLEPSVAGRRVAALRIDDPRWCAPLHPSELRDAVEGVPARGAVVLQIERDGRLEYVAFERE